MHQNHVSTVTKITFSYLAKTPKKHIFFQSKFVTVKSMTNSQVRQIYRISPRTKLFFGAKKIRNKTVSWRKEEESLISNDSRQKSCSLINFHHQKNARPGLFRFHDISFVLKALKQWDKGFRTSSMRLENPHLFTILYLFTWLLIELELQVHMETGRFDH